MNVVNQWGPYYDINGVLVEEASFDINMTEGDVLLVLEYLSQTTNKFAMAGILAAENGRELDNEEKRLIDKEYKKCGALVDVLNKQFVFRQDGGLEWTDRWGEQSDE